LTAARGRPVAAGRAAVDEALVVVAALDVVAVAGVRACGVAEALSV
jgi:hypothetical protein